MVDRIKSTVEIHAPANVCYSQWHRFTEFPKFMNRVKHVTPIGDNRWHWVISTPMGQDIEWDAIIDGDERNRMVSWHTVNHPKVEVQGTARFDEVAPNLTTLTCTMQYTVHASPITEAVTELLTHPQTMLDEELLHFKHQVEGTNVPAARANKGKTLAASTGQATKMAPPGYVGPFDLEEVLAEEGVAVEDIEDPAIRDMIFEENPYLGVRGAWEDEDVWPEPVETQPETLDVFSDSLDVYDEDLENYTQDMDDNMDSVFITGQSIEEYEMIQEAEQIKPKRIQSEL